MEDLREEPELEECEEEFEEDIEDDNSSSESSNMDEDIMVRRSPVRKSSMTNSLEKKKVSENEYYDSDNIYPEKKLLETNFSVTGINEIQTEYVSAQNRKFDIDNEVANNNKNVVQRPVSLNLQCL